jgi:hypothetical protein
MTEETLTKAPRELVEIVADAMQDYGPDGHCDGAAEISAAALGWCIKIVEQYSNMDADAERVVKWILEDLRAHR